MRARTHKSSAMPLAAGLVAILILAAFVGSGFLALLILMAAVGALGKHQKRVGHAAALKRAKFYGWNRRGR